MKPTAWPDPKASIYSAAGDITLTATNGSIVDGWNERPTLLTDEEVSQVDANLALSGTPAENAARTAIRAEENLVTTLYHDYWSEDRNLTRNGTPDRSITISAIDHSTDQITTTNEHGLKTGDQVFFKPAADFAGVVNLAANVSYYAIEIDPTTLQLANSRYNAAIVETPTFLDITVTNANNLEPEPDFSSGFELQTFGYTASSDVITSDVGPRYDAQRALEEEQLVTTFYHDYWSSERDLTPEAGAARTINISAINFDTNQITTSTNHNLRTGDQTFFQLGAGSDNPLNLDAETAYYAIVSDATTLQLARSRNDAAFKEPPEVFEITNNSATGISSWDNFTLTEGRHYTTTDYDAEAEVNPLYDTEAALAQEELTTTLYHRYWIDERQLARNANAARTINISNIDFINGQITTDDFTTGKLS